MACTLEVAWDEGLIGYDFGPGHPLAPVRVELTIALARAFGIFDRPGLGDGAAAGHGEELELVHDPGYIAAVRRAGATGQPDAGARARHPGRPGVPRHARGVRAGRGGHPGRGAGGVDGRAEHGANVAGGLHHAMRGSASGFCVYNDPAIAISWLLGQGARAGGLRRSRRAPWRRRAGGLLRRSPGADDQPARAPGHAVPRDGAADRDRPGRRARHGGQRRAAGRDRRRGLAARAGRGRAAAGARVPARRAGQPARLRQSPAGSAGAPRAQPRRAAQRAGVLHELAHETAGGRWLLTGGGGYELVQVVPRCWTHLLAEAAGGPIDPQAQTPRPGASTSATGPAGSRRRP